MSRPESGNLVQRLVTEAKANPGRAGMFTLTAVVMVVLWAKIFWTSQTAPPAASAKPVNTVASKTVAQTSGNAAARSALAEWIKPPLSEVKRNLFSVKLDFFPSDGSKLPNAPGVEGTGFWEQLAKSLALRADHVNAREHLLANLKREAAKLDLQSTVVSDGLPKAMINGKLLGEDELVNGFRIVRIEARRIVIEREGVRLEVSFRN